MNDPCAALNLPRDGTGGSHKNRVVLRSGRGFPRGGEKSGLVLELWDKQICGHLDVLSTG